MPSFLLGLPATLPSPHHHPDIVIVLKIKIPTHLLLHDPLVSPSPSTSPPQQPTLTCPPINSIMRILGSCILLGRLNHGDLRDGRMGRLYQCKCKVRWMEARIYDSIISIFFLNFFLFLIDTYYLSSLSVVAFQIKLYTWLNDGGTFMVCCKSMIIDTLERYSL